MKKNIFQILALVLILGLSFANCHSKSDNSLYQTNALLLNYLNDQLSGNCAVVQKFTDSSGVVTYTATGSTVPKGGCNSTTLGSFYTITPSEVVTRSDAYFNKITAILDTYTACSSMSSIVKGATSSTQLNTALAGTTFTNSVITATTAANITTLATANTADSSTAGPKNCKTVKIGLLYTAGIACSTQTDITNAGNNIQYNVVNSVTTDMNANFEGNRLILSEAKTTNDSINLYTKSAITAMRMMTSAEISTLTSSTNSPKLDSYALTAGLASSLTTAIGAGAPLNALAATVAPLITTAPSCLAALTAGDATTKDYLIRIPAAQYTTTANTNITFADKQAVTTPFVPSISCRYGTGVTATNTTISTSTAGVGLCPATYPSF